MMMLLLGWKKKKVPEIKEERKSLGLGAHGKKAELIARLEGRGGPAGEFPTNIFEPGKK
jgi:hypothetical protein